MKTSTYDLIKNFVDDILHQKWGDLVGAGLIALGVWMIMHSADPMVRDQGKGLIGAGMITLRPKSVEKNGNTETSTTTVQTTQTPPPSADLPASPIQASDLSNIPWRPDDTSAVHGQKRAKP